MVDIYNIINDWVKSDKILNKYFDVRGRTIVVRYSEDQGPKYEYIGCMTDQHILLGYSGDVSGYEECINYTDPQLFGQLRKKLMSIINSGMASKN